MEIYCQAIHLARIRDSIKVSLLLLFKTLEMRRVGMIEYIYSALPGLGHEKFEPKTARKGLSGT